VSWIEVRAADQGLGRLLAQAATAPLWRRLVGRTAVTFLLLALAFGIAAFGGLGHDGHGEGQSHALSHVPWLRAASLAIGVIVPVGLVARRLPAGRLGYLLAGLVGGLGFGVGAVLGVFLSELHHPPAEAWGFAVGAAFGGVESLRGWLLAASAGGAVGVASRARATGQPTLGRVWVGALALVVILAVAGAIGQGWVPPLPVLLASLVIICIPLAQLSVLVLLFADAVSMGPIDMEPEDPGPKPAVPWVDRLMSGAAGGGWLEWAVILLAVGAGWLAGQLVLGLCVGMLTWLALKILLAVGSQLWVRRIVKTDPQRAVRYAIHRAHGRTGALAVSTKADLVGAMAAAEEYVGARIAAKELAALDGVTFQLAGGAAASLCGIDAHEEALAVLDACKPSKGKAHGMRTVTRSAALIGLGRFDEAIQSLEALGTSSHKKTEAVRLNNRVVAAIAVEDPLDSRWVDAARKAVELWPGPMPQGTLAGALIRSGVDPAAGVATLEPVVSGAYEDSYDASESGWAFRAWVFGCGLRALGREEEAREWFQRAIDLGTVWGDLAEDALGHPAEDVRPSAPQGPPGAEEVAGVEGEGGDEPPPEDPEA